MWKKCQIIGLIIVLFVIEQLLIAFPLSITAAHKSLTTGQMLLSLFLILCGLVIIIGYLRKKSAIFSLDIRQLLGDSLKGLAMTWTVSMIGHLVLNLQGQTTTDNQASIENLFGNFPLFFLFLFIVVIAPLYEETIFRYLIMNRLLSSNPFIAWLISSLAFAAVHGPTNLGSFIIYFGMGGVLGYSYYKSNNLATSVSIHIANNLIGFLALAWGLS